jgi:ATP-dependent DNA ligase
MPRLESLPQREATFIEPMECLAVSKLPEGPAWIYEIKLDGYRAVAINSKGQLSLVSRNRKSFNSQYPYIIEALSDLPENTVVDGEVVALDDAGRPNFNLLQHSRSHASRICYFVFDLLVHNNRDLTRLSYIQRCEIMVTLKFRSPRIRITHHFETSVEEMILAVRDQGLEGVVAKRKDSLYESGRRTGAWAKYRLNRGQELVIGGIRAWAAWLGFHHRWLLPSERISLRGPSSERLCACLATAGIREAAPPDESDLPVHESS